MRGATVTSVGYGYHERKPHFAYDGLRRSVESRVTSIAPTLVRFQTTDGGTCFGDSGGPQFLDGSVVSVASSGDAACAGMGDGYRVDTESARMFLAQFLR